LGESPTTVNPFASATDAAPIHLVDCETSVQRAVTAISALEEVALDTEFHSERRYHPQLMLLQVCGPTGETWLADPSAVDVGPIIRAVSARRVVVHAGQEDLAIMQREADTAPRELLDVQIAAGMLGLGYPSRLGVLIREILGYEIDKQATLSDWSQRPLSSNQIHYAVQDVRILLPLSQQIRTDLVTRGRLQWAEAASEEMAVRATRPAATKHTWSSWEIAPQLDDITRATLQAIFEWRDARGRDKDQPPHYMLSDGLALDVARRQPRSIDELQANRRVPGGLIRRFGADIVAVVAQATLLDLSQVDVPSTAQRQRATGLELWAAIQAEATGIAPKLAMPRRVALAVAGHGAAALTGWRAEAMHDAVSALLSGEDGLFFDPAKMVVR
jgi:ribonuclease D